MQPLIPAAFAIKSPIHTHRPVLLPLLPFNGRNWTPEVLKLAAFLQSRLPANKKDHGLSGQYYACHAYRKRNSSVQHSDNSSQNRCVSWNELDDQLTGYNYQHIGAFTTWHRSRPGLAGRRGGGGYNRGRAIYPSKCQGDEALLELRKLLPQLLRIWDVSWPAPVSPGLF